MKYFDLNIKKILENWGIENAVREIIANAIDESLISGTKDIQVYKEGKYWYIRDYGRGLKVENFSQNENKEKISNEKVIGNYGVGLKDAIAVFHKNSIFLEIKTKNFVAHPEWHIKKGFDENTIHMAISESNSNFAGTQFKIEVDDNIIDKAKALFLFFKDQTPLSKSLWGEIYDNNKGEIYLNGLIIAENKNFVYSYNILTKPKKLIKNLNRERTNVGKEAYSDIISKILINSNDEDVAFKIDYNKETSEEFKIKATREFIYNKLYSNTIALTQSQFEHISDETKKRIKASGKQIKIVLQKDIGFFEKNKKFPTLSGFLSDYHESLNVKELGIKDLNKVQLKNFKLIMSIFKVLKKNINLNFKRKTIKVTDKIIDLVGCEVLGMWRENTNSIIISKEALNTGEQTIKTFLHEVAHSLNNFEDGTREFEDDLGEMILFASRYL